jgi:hypothetical protein
MYYHVVLGKKHIDLIKADSKTDAIKKIELIFGTADKYSATHKYQAIKA